MLVKLAAVIILTVVVFYLFIAGYFYFFQKKFIFFPSRLLKIIPSSLPIEEVFIETSDGEQLHAWWMQTNEGENTVLFFHGNAGNISDRKFQLEVFHKLGLNALIFDYRGYGKSTGKVLVEEDVYIDGRAALDFLVSEKEISLDNIILWGKSLGGGIAVDLAQNKSIRAVILESTFYSVKFLAKEKYRFLPVNILLRYKFESYKKIVNVSRPILIIHSRDDEMIPFSHGEKLYDLANMPKRMMVLSGSHNSAAMKERDEYVVVVRDFLKEY